MSGFDPQWLAQREPFDLAARSSKLERRFAHFLQQRTRSATTPYRLLDLGGGTAANFRALAPRLDVDQRWLLCDHDLTLLASIPHSLTQWSQAHGWRCHTTADSVVVWAGSRRWSLETRSINLAIDLESIDATQWDGVTTTAFLDLVSKAWLERLVDWIDAASVPFLATLTVEGRRQWTPELQADIDIHESFRQHQTGDKGFGPSLGPSAAQSLEQLFGQRGVCCETDASDWHIGAQSTHMLRRMADESAAIAIASQPSSRQELEAWLQERKQLIAGGCASLTIGHLDLLAYPRSLCTAELDADSQPHPSST